MGRGRAKAKQQKVARELKYNTHFTDLDALQRELGTSTGADSPRRAVGGVDADPEDDEYSRYSVDDSETDADDEYDGWTGTER